MAKSDSKGTLRDLVVYRLESAASQVFRRRNQMSYGVDGVTLRQFAGEWKHRKPEIQRAIRDDSYEFSPIRPVVVKKNQAKPRALDNARPISVLTVQDRVVQRAILHAIWTSIRDQVYTPWSFGGIREYKVGAKQVTRLERPAKSVRQAVERITQLQDQGNSFVFETDIKSFYQNIDRGRLKERLFATLRDDSISGLLSRAIAVEVDNHIALGDFATLWNPGTGVPQGAVLSPILANFYLHEFDRQLHEEGLNLVRYVDDLVVLGPDCETVERAHELVASTLPRFNLDIHAMDVPDTKGRVKTRIRRPGESFEFLGVEISRRSIQPTRTKWEDVRVTVCELTDARDINRRALVEVVGALNHAITGWVAAFSFCNISAVDLENRVDQLVRSRVATWLCRANIRTDPNPLSKQSANRLGLRPSASRPITPIRTQ